LLLEVLLANSVFQHPRSKVYKEDFLHLEWRKHRTGKTGLPEVMEKSWQAGMIP
jgi:hypothetical protein